MPLNIITLVMPLSLVAPETLQYLTQAGAALNFNSICTLLSVAVRWLATLVRRVICLVVPRWYTLTRRVRLLTRGPMTRIWWLVPLFNYCLSRLRLLMLLLMAIRGGMSLWTAQHRLRKVAWVVMALLRLLSRKRLWLASRLPVKWNILK